MHCLLGRCTICCVDLTITRVEAFIGVEEYDAVTAYTTFTRSTTMDMGHAQPRSTAGARISELFRPNRFPWKATTEEPWPQPPPCNCRHTLRIHASSAATSSQEVVHTLLCHRIELDVTPHVYNPPTTIPHAYAHARSRQLFSRAPSCVHTSLSLSPTLHSSVVGMYMVSF